MQTSATTSRFSRRTAFMGLGAAGLGLAASRDRLFAQQGTPTSQESPASYLPTIGHGVIGAWEIDVDASCPGCTISYANFCPDGTFVWSNASDDAVVGIGTWEPTGERTIELAFLLQSIDPAQAQDLLNWDIAQTPHGTGFVSPHLLYWRVSLTLDETGKTMTSAGFFQGYDHSGNPGFNSGEMVMKWTRMITDPEASFSTPMP